MRYPGFFSLGGGGRLAAGDAGCGIAATFGFGGADARGGGLGLFAFGDVANFGVGPGAMV